MAAATPTLEPAVLVAGDTAKWLKTLDDYPAPTWVLTYTLVSAAQRYTFTASASGSSHLVTVAASTTSGWAAGRYDWRAQVASGAEVYTVGAGSLTIQPSFAAATDARSSARKALEAVQAYLADSNNLQAAEYQIAGRQLKRIALAELIALKTHLQVEVGREDAASAAAAGLPDPRRVLVRYAAR